MRNDGKIKNGLSLKKSEEGLFRRIISKIYWNNEAWYKLSYDEQEHKYFDKEFLLKYLNEKYLNDNNKEKNEKNLINDLITFKTYRDSVDINVRKESDFGHFITICLAFIPIIISVMLDYDSKISISLFAGFLVLVNLVFYKLTTGSNSESYKLMVINNVIYALEAIKEDMEKNENSGMKNTEMNCNVNDYQSDYKTDEKITKAKSFTENDEGRYDGLELTEVKEIRTYKATRNRYSPRAMHERKRR
ncbi:hypothetical protein [Finegoldia magna]|uniref:hypothetical protein n=1 Tax=Finegoldia magna TaxID=1260 RepID=UPI0007643A69|nr:hypothetical protein [Finegoldia magna]KXA10888.1 hypothetical protein HMPREF3217_00173 [Finegoldia magna]